MDFLITALVKVVIFHSYVSLPEGISYAITSHELAVGSPTQSIQVSLLCKGAMEGLGSLFIDGIGGTPSSGFVGAGCAGAAGVAGAAGAGCAWGQCDTRRP